MLLVAEVRRARARDWEASMRVTSIGLGCVLLGVIIAACSGTNNNSSSSDGGASSGSHASSGAGDNDCPAGTICDIPTSTCVPGGGCAGQEIMADIVPPNLLVVLDRSCSMTQMVSGKTKWQIAVDALNKLTTDYAMKIRFGLTL